MANEVVVEEYQSYDANMGIPTIPITTQVLDIATLSAALNPLTKYVRIRSKGTGFWFKFGGAAVSAVANTNGNSWLPADQFVDHQIGAGNYLDTAT